MENNTGTNNTGTPAKLHPALWVAAIAVTLFSLVGIGAVTGILPMGGNKTEPTPAVAANPAPVATPAQVATPEPAPAPVVAAPSVKPAPKPVAAAPRKPTTHYSSNPRQIDEQNNDVYRSNSVSYPPPPPAAAATCRNCGIVESVNAIKEKGEGTGLGAVAGGVAGAVVGNQVGKGGGRDIARIIGIAGGAFAGHEIEKSQRSHTTYDVNVRLDDGSMRTFHQESQPAWQAGDRIRIEDGNIIPR